MTPPAIGRVVASLALLLLGAAGSSSAQTATFSDVLDAVPARCYNAAATQPDPSNPNRLVIAMHTGIVPGSFGTAAGCVAYDSGPSSTMDTISLVVNAPAGFYVSKVTFTQSGTTSGSRGGAGFRGATWVVGGDARTVSSATGGWAATFDLTGKNQTTVPVTITTFLAAAGGTVRSGSARASNASVLVELAPLAGPPPPPPPTNPVPIVSSTSPSNVTAGASAYTVSVTGQRFVVGSTVRWNGVDVPTVALSGAQLRATIPGPSVAVAGSAEVTVFNPPTPYYLVDGGLSNPVTVTVNPAPTPNPVPTTTLLEPSSVGVGTGAFVLTVNGTGFVPGAVIRWNGLNRTTTFVSSTRLTATIGMFDVFAEGSVPITVSNPATGFNPPPDGGVSNPQVFTVTSAPIAPPPSPGPAPTLVGGNVNDQRGKEWRQLVQTVGLTEVQVAPLCPADGAIPFRCVGRVGAVDLTGWVWARSPEVIDLFRAFTTGVSEATPTVGGFEYATPATQFQGLFALTQRVSGCPTYQGCFDFRSVGGVTASTDLGGLPVGGSVTLSEELFGANGGFSVASVTTLGASPRGVFLWRPTGLGTGRPHVNNDEGVSLSPFGGAAVDVRANDWVGGAQATASNSVVTMTAIAPATDRITLGSSGLVQVLPGATAGTYTLGYTLCLPADPAACSSADVTVVVRSYVLVATNDQATANYGGGGSPVNVLTNDRLNGAAVTTGVVLLRQVSSTHAGIALNALSGAVAVAAGTPSGTHALVYEICELANLTNCKQATVTLTGSTIDAVDDVFPKLSKDGGTSPSVLTHDRFNGAVATTARVTLSLVTPLPAGVALDLATGRFVVSSTDSGDYAVTYRICEIGSATTCDTASLILEISGSAD